MRKHGDETSTHSENALTPWVCLCAAMPRCGGRSRPSCRRPRADVNDYEALALLAQRRTGPHAARDLAEALQLSPSGVTRLLDGLEEHGLVKKLGLPGDGRVTTLR